MTIFRSSALIAVLLLAGCGAPAVKNEAPEAAATPDATPARVVPEDEARAFQAVFGQASPIAVKVKQDEEITRSEQLIRLGDRAVLITSTQLKQGCHYCAGWLGIYYLKPAGDSFTVTGRFPHAVDGSGGAPAWTVSDRFGSLAIESKSGSGGQGYVCNWLELVDFPPEGPRKLVKVTVDFDETGPGPDIIPGSLQVSGKIGDIVPGKSFTVDYSGIKVATGKQRFSETYRRTATGYARVGKSRVESCPNLSLDTQPS